jgi:thiamine biosynthesis lipoprotein
VHWRIGLALSLVTLATPQPRLQRFESVEPHMGTLVRVTVYTPDERRARAAFEAAFSRIRALDAILSDYRPDSELNRITTKAVGREVRVSDDLFTVLAASQQLAEATAGAFDVTLKPVVQLWREARTTKRIPDPIALHEAAGRTGYRKLQLYAGRRTVRLDLPGMALDVGAIGKGYAASEAIEAVSKLGVRSALVAISGDLAFSDAPPGGRGWRVAVHDGDPSLAGVPRVLELSNGAVSTSGNREQYVDVHGQRYSHVIDPASRMGLTEDVTVTVIAPHGLEADGLDTAISVIGAERGLQLIETRPRVAALILQRSGDATRVFQSAGFTHLTRASAD